METTRHSQALKAESQDKAYTLASYKAYAHVDEKLQTRRGGAKQSAYEEKHGNSGQAGTASEQSFGDDGKFEIHKIPRDG